MVFKLGRESSSSSAEMMDTDVAPRSSGGILWCCGKSDTRRENSNSTTYSRRVRRGRVWFILSLCAAALTLGFVVHHYTTTAEEDLAERQFQSLADRVLDDAVSIFRQKRLSLLLMATTIGNLHPDASEYPFMYVKGYTELSSQLLDATKGKHDMVYGPIVTIEQQKDWEDFTYNYFFHERDPVRDPEEAIVASFGWGIYARNYSMTNATDGDQRYHDNYPTRHWNSSYPNLKVPAFHSEEDDTTKYLLYNLKAEETRGRPIDGILDCVKEHKVAGTLESATCGAVSVMYKSKKFGQPAALLFQPVFPQNDRDTITGFTSSSIPFSDIVENVFAETVSGVDVVVSANAGALHSFTYHIRNGIAEGVEYNQRLPSLKSPFTPHCRSLIQDKELYGGKNSTEYEICLSATEEFKETYATNNPRAATLVSVVVIVATTIFFLIYDVAVRNGVEHKKALLKAKRRFMRWVSHEVRTPLNAVYMGLKVMQTEIARNMGYESIEELEKHAEEFENAGFQKKGCPVEIFQLTQEVLESTESATNVLSNLLNYDKIEHGEMQLEMSVIPFGHLVQRTVKEFQLSMTKKKLQLTLDISEFMDREENPNHTETSSISTLTMEPYCTKVVGDAVRLTLVLRNVLSNAVKFTPEGGRIHVKASRSPCRSPRYMKSFEMKNGEVASFPYYGQTELTISDTGVGMTPDQLNKLFLEGQQFNAGVLQGGNGSGLGLFISRGIVSQHEGLLTAESDGLGEGTSFSLTLPLYRVSCESSTDSSTPESNACVHEDENPLVEKEPRSKHVLIVDDVLSNRKLLGRLLKSRNCTYDEADDGDVAVDKVAQALEEGKKYDCILMDFEMNRMSGPEAAKIIRSQGNSVLIVGVTGNLKPEDVKLFEASGADVVFGKPFDVNKLDELWRQSVLQ